MSGPLLRGANGAPQAPAITTDTHQHGPTAESREARSVSAAATATTDALKPVNHVIAVEAVTKTFETLSGTQTALDNLDFYAKEGEFVSIVGPSGCGKSTLLFILSGLERATSGSVKVLGTEQRGPHPEVGLVFQRDAVLPWRTAVQNVALPLRFRGVPRREAQDAAREWLSRVGLAKFENNYPHQLSGGMRKRVAIAASLCYRPKVLLMDEPFSALDAQTRYLMETDLLHIWEESKQTVIFITHDLEEAIALSDRVVTMTAAPGRILSDIRIELERPRELQAIRFDPRFAELHEHLWAGLRAEVLASSAGSAMVTGALSKGAK